LCAGNHRPSSRGKTRPDNYPRLLGEGREGAHRDDRRGVSYDRVRAEDLERVVVAGGEDFLQLITGDGELA